jgi:hypothetical protein
VIGRPRHLHDDRLYECYIAERGGERVDPPSADHLADCAECSARYGELARFMDGLRDEAERETDEIFTREQLRLQQQHISRRIEHLGHPARVLSFPARIVRKHFTSSTGRLAPRWAAVAAAAGLLVGVGVGIFFDSRSRVTVPVAAAINAPRPVRIPASLAAPILDDDDAFLSEIEAVVGGPHNVELLPFDTLTPRTREVSSRSLRY